MQPNRANEPVPTTVLPTGSAAPRARPRPRRRGINPWFILLITVIPILSLACMFFSLGWYGNDWNAFAYNNPMLGAQSPTPLSPLSGQIALNYSSGSSYALDQNNFINITGKLTNNTGLDLHSVQLKGYAYSTASDGTKANVGFGTGNVVNVAAGQTVDFSVPVQIGSVPIPAKPGVTPVVPGTYNSVTVNVDSIWSGGSSTPTP